MRIATANIKKTLPTGKAQAALAAVLDRRPHLFGLQEWDRPRNRLLREAGVLVRFPRLRRRMPNEGWVFARPVLGGPPVGVDAARFDLLVVRRVMLARRRGRVRATPATEAVARDRRTGRIHALLNVHLLAHHDDPAHLAGWQEGRESVLRWIESWHGFDTWVVGDVNKHLLDLPPLTSCWTGNRPQRTFGARTIDGVWGREPAESADAFGMGSDHRGVIADY